MFLRYDSFSLCMTYTYDAIIIGLGSAGKATAETLQKAGKKIVCFDNGGPATLCAREGCMPSKALFTPVDVYYRMRKFRDVVEGVEKLDMNFDNLLNYVRKITDSDFVAYTEKSRQKVGFIAQKATLIDGHTVESDGKIYTAEHIVVATGSTPIIPSIKGLSETPFWGSREVFQLTSGKITQKELGIIGSGVIACEMAQCFAKLGFSVVMYSRSGQILRSFSREVAEKVKKVFEDEYKIKFEKLDEKFINYDESKSKFVFSSGTQHSHLLVVSGRKQNLPEGSCGLIEFTEKKEVKRNEFLQSSIDSIFVIGDSGGIQLLHETNDEGVHVANQIISGQYTPYKTTHLSVAFTFPHIASVGKRNDAQFVGSADFEFGRATIEREEDGIIQIYVSKEGIVQGGEIVHHQADTLIHIIQEMIGKSIHAVGPFYHPTLPEGIENALDDAKEKLN